MQQINRSLTSLHLAVLLLAGTAQFSHLIPLSATDITGGRSLFACLILVLVVKVSGAKLRLQNKQDYLIAIGLGMLMAAHWVTYFAAMQYASVSVGMIALFTFPVIAVLLEPFFEGIRLAWQDLLSAIIVLIGIIFIVPDFTMQNEVTLGIAVGILSAFLYAIRNLSMRKYFSHVNGATSFCYQTLVIFLCTVGFASDQLIQSNSHTLLLLLVLGTFFTALPHTLVVIALKHVRVKTFSLIGCMQPFYGVVLAILLLGESPRWQTLVGGLLIVSAALYETFNTRKNNRA